MKAIGHSNVALDQVQLKTHRKAGAGSQTGLCIDTMFQWSWRREVVSTKLLRYAASTKLLRHAASTNANFAVTFLATVFPLSLSRIHTSPMSVSLTLPIICVTWPHVVL